MSEATPNPLTEAIEQFKDGYAVAAASILQKYAEQLSNQANFVGVEGKAIRQRSDAIAALGIKIFNSGDAMNRHEFTRYS
jgi:hypothetical protein